MANDYELNPELVGSKFFERYQSVEAVLLVAAHDADRPSRVWAAVQKGVEKYGHYRSPQYVGLEVQIEGRESIPVYLVEGAAAPYAARKAWTTRFR